MSKKSKPKEYTPLTPSEMEVVKKALVKARADLIFNHPFFGVLALHLKLQPIESPVEYINHDGVKTPATGMTFGTDGRKLVYNPRLIKAQMDAHDSNKAHDMLVAQIAHEVMHNVFNHVGEMSRMGSRKFHTKWNMAGDYAINPLLKDCGFAIEDW